VRNWPTTKSLITSKTKICNLKDGDGRRGVGGVKLWTHYVVVLLLSGTSLCTCANKIRREKANKQTIEKKVKHVLCVQIMNRKVATTNDVYYSFLLLLLRNGS